MKSKFGSKNRRLGINDQVPITYGIDFLYTGELYVGESDQEMRVIYDTGSDLLAIEGRGCQTCDGNRYDPNTSSYYNEIDIRTLNKEYGSFIHLQGKTVEDQMCLKSFSLCMDPVQFFLVSDQYGIPSDADGILGLTQGKEPRSGFNLPSDFEVAPLFLDNLEYAYHIFEKSFSTRFTGRFGQSFVDFGPYRAEEMSDVNDFVEIPVNEGYFYSIVPQGIRFGSELAGEEFVLDGSQAIFTTGISVSMVPSSLSSIFFKRLLDGSDAYEENGVFFSNCGVELPDVWIMAGGYWIQIRGRDLLTDISEPQDNTLCLVNFLPSVDNFWVFGNTIYKDYYVYHNPDRGVMGWVPTIERFKTALVGAPVPTTPIEYQYNVELAYIKGVSALGIIVATILVAQFVFTTSFTGITFLN